MTTKIKAGVIGDGVVGTTQIADDAVTAAKLLAGLNDLSTATVSSSSPAIDTNPSSGVGTLWVKTDGNAYILTDATAGANVWTNVGNGSTNVEPFSATGGTITTVGSYKVHTFTSSGTFTPNSSASNIDIMLVAGGAAGGSNLGGGGGAGGVLVSTSQSVTAQGYTITIGAGGTTSQGANQSGAGSNTTGLGLTAVGGGYATSQNNNSAVGGSGGSGIVVIRYPA